MIMVSCFGRRTERSEEVKKRKPKKKKKKQKGNLSHCNEGEDSGVIFRIPADVKYKSKRQKFEFLVCGDS